MARGLGGWLAASLLGVMLAAPLASAAASPRSAHTPHYCDGCQPPLEYSGGHVLNTHSSHGVTVTPIFWAPSATRYAFPPSYVNVVDQYLTDVAAASGSATNVYSIDSEYFDLAGGLPQNIGYHISLGTPLLDLGRFPSRGCRPAPGYSACVTEGGMVRELDAVLRTRHLPRGLTNFYPVLFPPGVETVASDGTNSIDSYCGYHDSVGTGTSLLVYANEPYIGDGCFTGQAPNGDRFGDSEASILSHELNEAITDPDQGGRTGWRDRGGNEIGDLCTDHYGPPLGSADPTTPQTTEFNQLINGHLYYTQTEFSNYAYHRFGVGKGCQPSESTARSVTRAGAGSGVKIVSYPAPTSLPADGRSTGSISYSVTHNGGQPLAQDHLSLSTYLQSGTGACGTVDPQAVRTSDAGLAKVTYHASRANAACVVVATDAIGGRAVSAVFYQGTTRDRAIVEDDTLPNIVRAGRSATFTTSFGNPMSRALNDATLQFFIFPADDRSPDLQAGQFRLYVSWHGRGGPFTAVRLTGSTQGDGGIVGTIGPPSGFTIGARRTQTFTLRLVTAGSVPRHRRAPIVSLSAILSQLNPASGDTTALGYAINDARVR